MSRPAFKIDANVCKKAKKFASQGMTQEQIAQALGMGETTFYEKQAKYPEFAEAIKHGQANGIQKVTNSLFKTANKGNVAAQIFYLKNRAQWRDRFDVENSGVITHEHTGVSDYNGWLEEIGAKGSEKPATVALPN